jgi:hypothetical protein
VSPVAVNAVWHVKICVITGVTIFLEGGVHGTCKAEETTLSSSFRLIFFHEDVGAFVTFYIKNELDISIAVVVKIFL